jgi:hypothetical protein
MKTSATKKNANRHDMHLCTVKRDIGEPSLVRAAFSETRRTIICPRSLRPFKPSLSKASSRSTRHAGTLVALCSSASFPSASFRSFW